MIDLTVFGIDRCNIGDFIPPKYISKDDIYRVYDNDLFQTFFLKEEYIPLSYQDRWINNDIHQDLIFIRFRENLEFRKILVRARKLKLERIKDKNE